MDGVKGQSFDNHVRRPPGMYIFAGVVLVANLVSRLAAMRHGITFGSILNVLLAFALLLSLFYARAFALTVQDRLIRLEMRLRLAELLPSDLRSRIAEFTLSQMVAMRFASDEELPMLARQVLDEKLTDRKQIKQRIKSWQADFLRA